MCSIAIATQSAVNLPGTFEQETIVDDLDRPTAIAYSPDGRLFVTEKVGRVRIVTADGQLLPTPFVSVTTNTQNDRGLLGIVLHPNFAQNGWVYLHYVTEIVPPAPNNGFSRYDRISRFTANGNVVVPGSELVIVDTIESDMDSHNGGALRFGLDDKLYVTTGDGASYGSADPLALRAQNLDRLEGKVLRLNDDGSAPSDNPFYTTPTANRSKLWQYGLRNPFKAAIRPSNGRLFISDVGWASWEEVNAAPSGANFGWPCWEGNGKQLIYDTVFRSQCRNVVGRAPNWTYPHTGDGGAVVGSAFYQGPNYPSSYDGDLFVADYAQRWIKQLDVDDNDAVTAVEDFASGDDDFRPVDLLLAPDGNLHYVNIASDFAVPSGSVRRILYVGSGNRSPRPKANVAPAYGYAPLLVQFDATGTSDPDNDPLSYEWSFGDGFQGNGFAVTHTYTANGTYLATLRVSDGQITREDKRLITVGSIPPVATITTPGADWTYQDGEVINYSGSALDADDGPLSGGALRWTILQHHNTHQHFFSESSGPSGSFVAEGHGATGEPLSYEVILTATDSSGLSQTVRHLLNENRAPTANAGPDFAARCQPLDARIYLDGTASSDPDNQPIQYAWTQVGGTTVVINEAQTARPWFFLPEQAGGILSFQLVVNDRHTSASDVVTVTLTNQTDADGDGFPECNDCAPNNAAIYPIGEVDGLQLADDDQTISWSPLSGANSYNLMRGTVSALPRYDYTCLHTALVGLNAADATIPATGDSFYYLTQAVDGCGQGSIGRGRFRVSLDPPHARPNACP
jgi:glucose/arabinose dehydrogenase